MNTASISQTRAVPLRKARVIAMATLLVGLGLVFVTGFSYSATVHNAAHDTRHALAFPCH